jgi:hypothetical protein
VVAEEQGSNPEAATKTEKSRAAVTTRLLTFGCGGSQPTLSAALATRGVKPFAKRQSAYSATVVF